MIKIIGRSLILGVLFVTAAWTRTSQAQIPSCPANSSTLNPAEILEIYNQKMVAQRDIVQTSIGYLTFVSGANQDNVIRKSFPDQSVKYQHGNLKLFGTKEQISQDEGCTRQDFLALELSSENYQINFDRDEGTSGNIYVYKLFPRGRRKGRFKDGSELSIDRTTCMPVEITGDVFGEMGVTPHLTAQFQQVKGLIFVAASKITAKKAFATYLLNVTYRYSPNDVILNAPY